MSVSLKQLIPVAEKGLVDHIIKRLEGKNQKSTFVVLEGYKGKILFSEISKYFWEKQPEEKTRNLLCKKGVSLGFVTSETNLKKIFSEAFLNKELGNSTGIEVLFKETLNKDPSEGLYFYTKHSEFLKNLHYLCLDAVLNRDIPSNCLKKTFKKLEVTPKEKNDLCQKIFKLKNFERKQRLIKAIGIYLGIFEEEFFLKNKKALFSCGANIFLIKTINLYSFEKNGKKEIALYAFQNFPSLFLTHYDSKYFDEEVLSEALEAYFLDFFLSKIGCSILFQKIRFEKLAPESPLFEHISNFHKVLPQEVEKKSSLLFLCPKLIDLFSPNVLIKMVANLEEKQIPALQNLENRFDLVKKLSKDYLSFILKNFELFNLHEKELLELIELSIKNFSSSLIFYYPKLLRHVPPGSEIQRNFILKILNLASHQMIYYNESWRSKEEVISEGLKELDIAKWEKKDLRALFEQAFSEGFASPGKLIFFPSISKKIKTAYLLSYIIEKKPIELNLSLIQKENFRLKPKLFKALFPYICKEHKIDQISHLIPFYAEEGEAQLEKLFQGFLSQNNVVIIQVLKLLFQDGKWHSLVKKWVADLASIYFSTIMKGLSGKEQESFFELFFSLDWDWNRRDLQNKLVDFSELFDRVFWLTLPKKVFEKFEIDLRRKLILNCIHRNTSDWPLKISPFLEHKDFDLKERKSFAQFACTKEKNGKKMKENRLGVHFRRLNQKKSQEEKIQQNPLEVIWKRLNLPHQNKKEALFFLELLKQLIQKEPEINFFLKVGQDFYLEFLPPLKVLEIFSLLNSQQLMKISQKEYLPWFQKLSHVEGTISLSFFYESLKFGAKKSLLDAFFAHFPKKKLSKTKAEVQNFYEFSKKYLFTPFEYFDSLFGNSKHTKEFLFNLCLNSSELRWLKFVSKKTQLFIVEKLIEKREESRLKNVFVLLSYEAALDCFSLMDQVKDKSILFEFIKHFPYNADYIELEVYCKIMDFYDTYKLELYPFYQLKIQCKTRDLPFAELHSTFETCLKVNSPIPDTFFKDFDDSFFLDFPDHNLLAHFLFKNDKERFVRLFPSLTLSKEEKKVLACKEPLPLEILFQLGLSKKEKREVISQLFSNKKFPAVETQPFFGVKLSTKKTSSIVNSYSYNAKDLIFYWSPFFQFESLKEEEKFIQRTQKNSI